jgi:hypothetical protein
VILAFVLGGLVLIFLHRKKDRYPRIVARLISFLAVVGLIVSAISVYEAKNFDGRIEKRNLDQGKMVEVLKARSGKNQTQIDFEIPRRKLSDREVQSYFKRAKMELDDTLLGKNESLDSVQEDLVLKESYVGGKVLSQWDVDGEIISADGKIHNYKLKKSRLVPLSVTFSLDGRIKEYRFYVRVKRFDARVAAVYSGALRDETDRLMKDKSEKRFIQLPKVISNQNVVWSKKVDDRGLYLELLLVFILMIFPMMEKEKELQERKRREQVLSEDYPKIVEKLSLYISSGMSVRKAMSLIKKGYEKRLLIIDEKRDGFELVKNCAQFLENGASESECFSMLSNGSSHRDYKRLSLILLQNLKGGNSELKNVLMKEVYDAQSKSRKLMKMRGEMISTKLVVPLMGMLLVVMLILIVPGIWGISI